ncbi:MAG: hypothetical protein RIS92_1975, partial [Verrucomicrobiota bacterium]
MALDWTLNPPTPFHSADFLPLPRFFPAPFFPPSPDPTSLRSVFGVGILAW